MRYMMSITLLLFFTFCNYSNKKIETITENNFKQLEQENSEVDERFRDNEEFVYDSLGNLIAYKFHKLSNYDSLLCGIVYSNDTLSNIYSANYKLVIAREHFDNGDVIFHLISPPFMLMETYITYEDEKNNEIRADTIYGSNIKVNMVDVHKIHIEVGAIDIVTNKLLYENFGFKLDTFINSGVLSR